MKINIIGRGNVATHLNKAFSGSNTVELINPHTLENLDYTSDIILICVSDDAIEGIIRKLNVCDSIIAHTSGSVSIDLFKDKFKNYGVFYPLQTFTKNVELNYSEIPVFIEGSSEDVSKKLIDLGSTFANKIVFANSASRRKLHLASVFACNFTNALARIADNILSDTNIPFENILPLMHQTVNKLNFLSPEEAQTGPAVRGDKKVMEAHLNLLKDAPELAELYKLFSGIIMGNKK